ncbi:hypothetical protein Q3G72_028070 [Acer saccharum]|nr:hypothetical protein Q3G72_028070 [Acer saccharum]
MRATAPTKPVGNREWNPRYNSGNYRRQTNVMEGEGDIINGQKIPVRSRRVRGWWFDQRQKENQAATFRGGDEISNRRDKLGSEKGQAVIGKEITVTELAIENLTFTNGGLGPKGIFVFGSNTDKETSDGPPDVDYSGLGDGITLGLSGLNSNMLEGSNSGNITKATGMEECIGPPCVDTTACKKNGGNGKRVGQWKKAARKNFGGVGNSDLKVSCSKRNEVGTVKSFTDGNKKPKYDSSASVSTVLSAGQQLLVRRTQ